MIETLVHVGQILLGVWFVVLVAALYRTWQELRRVRRIIESSRKLRLFDERDR